MSYRQLMVISVIIAVQSLFSAEVPWFDAGIRALPNWPKDGKDIVVKGEGTWTGTSNAVLSASRLLISSCSQRASLNFQPAVHKGEVAEKVVYKMTLRFESIGELPPVDKSSRLGLTATDTEDGRGAFAGIVADSNGDGNIWCVLAGAEPDETKDVEVMMTLLKSAEGVFVAYTVDGADLVLGARKWLPIRWEDDFSGDVSFVGDGQVASLAADIASSVPAAPCALTIPERAHVTVAKVSVGGEEVFADEHGAYVVERGSVVTIEFAPEVGWALTEFKTSVLVKSDMALAEDIMPNAVDISATVTISEIMAKNGVTARTKNGFGELDWVELRNTGDEDVDLTGWYLGNDPTKKTSKWPQIQGRCVVPAHGYVIVWCDGDGLCDSYADDEPHVECNISTDAGKHTIFLASKADKKAIVQQITMPAGIKDISYGLGHLSRTLIGPAPSAMYSIGNSEIWQSTTGAIGVAAGSERFKTVAYKVSKSVSTMDVAETCLADPSTWAPGYPVTNEVDRIAFVDNGSKGVFDSGYYSTFPGVSGNNFVLVATGTILLDESGDWSFAVGSDDGFSAKLTRQGRSWSWECRGARAYEQSAATFNLEAGAYEFEIVYYNATGGLALDFSAAKGRHEFDAKVFSLIGAGEIGAASSLAAEIATDVSAEISAGNTQVGWRAPFRLESAPSVGDVLTMNVRSLGAFTAKLNGCEVISAAKGGVFTMKADKLARGANLLELTADFVGTSSILGATLRYDRAEETFVYFTEPTPGRQNGAGGRTGFTPPIAFSEAHGYKEAPFELTLSCPENPTAAIYYTLDGTSPVIGAEGTYRYLSPITVAHTTVVRAASPDEDSILQADSSATYLFLEDILQQGAQAPAGFPEHKQVNSQAVFYGLDPAITQGDSETRERLRRGFVGSVRTVSLVIDPKHLFDKTSGIYVNATGNGRGWERQTMVEQINPADPSDEFSVAAGLRIRGAFSRGSSYPKHSFRLFFRSEYGMGSLNHPLFGSEGDKSFDKIDFRTSQNYSWSNDYDGDTFIHETFSRDTERDMGTTYNRSRYYNLFINGVYWGLYQTEERVAQNYAQSYNGVYWGLYQTEERVDQNYAESYNGGVASDYDIIRTSQPGYNTGVVEGENEAWENLWRITTTEGYGEDHPANYNRVRGLNPDGTRNVDYPVYLNVTNLIEFLLTAHFSADADSPVNTSGKANNIIAFRNRFDGKGEEDGFLWNRHDAEHSLGYGRGVSSESCIYYGTREQLSTKSDVLSLGNFNPQCLNYELMANAEYRMVFADIVYHHLLRKGGALTVEASQRRYRSRMAELDDVIVCESARWGHQYTKKRTRDTWLKNCSAQLDFIAKRAPYLIAAYRKHGWYPSIDSPTFDFVPKSMEELAVNVPSGTTVYYTLDGTDPRLEGGAIGGTKLEGTIVIPEKGATLSLRAYRNGEWSALERESVQRRKPAPMVITIR